MAEKEIICSECEDLSRRDVLRTMGGLALAGAVPLTAAMPTAFAAPTPKSDAETAVKAFHDLLTPEQKKVICFPFNHALRKRISANWKITPPTIGDDFYTKEQRTTLDQILRGITSPDGYGRLREQMKADYGGFERFTVAVFGEPGTDQFQWELTGRHLTLRADGNSVDKVAFGGPLVYGHGESNPEKNLFHYQTKKVNEVFGALEGKQRKTALLKRAPKENAVQLQGTEGTFPGIAYGELKKDQQKLVEEVLTTLLAPYRKEDVEEAMSFLKQDGGLDKLHMAFYTTGDLNDDEVWDIWRLESPTFVWHFRGAPHVHAYINIGMKTETK